jgi:hypothetical protein
MPVGYSTVPVILPKYVGRFVPWDPVEYPAAFLAGTIGKFGARGAPPGYSDALERVGSGASPAIPMHEQGSMKPLSGWALLGRYNHTAYIEWDHWEEFRHPNWSLDRFDTAQCHTTPLLRRI